MPVTLCVGTSAHGAWFSHDLGESFERPTSKAGLYLEAAIFSIAKHKERPNMMLAGTDRGVYRWDFAEKHWFHEPSPMDASGYSIWTLLRADDDPKIMLAGTRPAEFYRSDDEGKSWRMMLAPIEADIANDTRASRGYSDGRLMRVTSMMFDPADRNTIWAGIEIDAVHRSQDGGRSWTRLGEGLISDDIHDLAIIDHNGGRKIFATTNKGLHRSDDNGATWRFTPLDSSWQYTRRITPRADNSGVIFLTNGNGPPGDSGRLWRSRDWGDTWEDVPLPGKLNSTVWSVATDPSDPMLLFACSNLGQLFRSKDGGESWDRLTRELGDVRSLCWMPW
ncbi:MAG TPA: hypothetical protein VG986_08105 [Pseudolabrys sp.]|nr:hypothetical protein [Pseudolabrys sp.]